MVRTFLGYLILTTSTFERVFLECQSAFLCPCQKSMEYPDFTFKNSDKFFARKKMQN